MATQALTDQRETRANVVRVEAMATTVYQAHLDHQDLPHQARVAHTGTVLTRGRTRRRPAAPSDQDGITCRHKLVLKAPVVPQVQPDNQVHKDSRAQEVSQERWDPQAQQDREVLPDQVDQ